MAKIIPNNCIFAVTIWGKETMLLVIVLFNFVHFVAVTLNLDQKKLDSK